MGLVEAANKFSVKRALEGMSAGIGPVETNFKSFAYRRIRGAIFDEVRRQSFVKRRGHERGIKFDMVPIDKQRADGQSIVELPVQESFDPEWNEALSKLDERERFVVTGLASGYTGAEISAVLEITPSRVSQLNRRAKAKLRDYLEA